MIPPYPVLCYTPACGRPAAYKIASRWSDGVTEELKTYALCCEGCRAPCFHPARENQAACRLAAGETLEQPGIYHLERGLRDRQLARLPAREKALTEGQPSVPGRSS